MANLGDTGSGATIAFGTQSLSLAVKSIQFGATTVDMLDVTVLGTTDYMIEVADALKAAPEVTINFVFDTGATAPTVGTAAETLTVTFPLRAGETTAANMAGTGVVTNFTLPGLEVGQVQEGSLVFKYDGDTGPTYTVSS